MTQTKKHLFKKKHELIARSNQKKRLAYVKF